MLCIQIVNSHVLSIVGDSTIQSLDSVLNLGSSFDSNMSMAIHISKICSKAFHDLYKIRQITKFLSLRRLLFTLL